MQATLACHAKDVFTMDELLRVNWYHFPIGLLRE